MREINQEGLVWENERREDTFRFFRRGEIFKGHAPDPFKYCDELRTRSPASSFCDSHFPPTTTLDSSHSLIHSLHSALASRQRARERYDRRQWMTVESYTITLYAHCTGRRVGEMVECGWRWRADLDSPPSSTSRSILSLFINPIKA